MAVRARVPPLLLVAAAVLLAWTSGRRAKRQLDIDAHVDHGGCRDAPPGRTSGP